MKKIVISSFLFLALSAMLTSTADAQSTKDAMLARARAAVLSAKSAGLQPVKAIADVQLFDPNTGPGTWDFTDPSTNIHYAAFIAMGAPDGQYQIVTAPSTPLYTFDFSNGNIVAMSNPYTASGFGLWILVLYPTSGDLTVTATGSSVTYTETRNYGGTTKVSTTTTLTSLPSPSTYGDVVTLTATVTPSSGTGTPTGSVTFKDAGNSIGSVPLSGGSASIIPETLPAGTHSLTAEYSGDTNFDASNSNLSPVSQVVNKATPTVSVTGGPFTYDGNPHAVVTTSTGVGAASVSGSFSVTYNGSSTVPKNAGTYSINVTFTSSDLNYNDATGTGSMTINPATVTATFTVNPKVYNGLTDATIASHTFAGVIGSDDVSLTFGVATFGDKNVGTSKPVTVSGLGLSGASAANYQLSVAPVSASITSRPLTVTATAASRVYDATTAATVTLSDDQVPGDVVGVAFSSAAFSDKNVGVGKTVSVSGISISGTDATNYTLSNTTATTLADVTSRPLTVSATGVNKVYDGTTTATVTLSNNRVTGDVLTDSYASASFADPNVGTGKTVTVTGITISGTDAGNYALTSTTATTTADITSAVQKGLVAGAGWISSPAGAYVKKPTFTGKGYFAFTASSLGKGSNPTGVTVFVLKSGGLFSSTALSFGSISYDWMTISGAQATFGGTGKVSGASGYGFLLSTLDGHSTGTPDKFRIKIWDKNHNVVYDNQMGAADDAVPTSVVSGGVITITKSGSESPAMAAVDIQQVMDAESATEIPTEYGLYNAYPNPFNPSTTIAFDLPVPTNVRLVVYDMLGREVSVLVNQEEPAGHHLIKFDAGKLASGIYVYRLQAGNFVQTKKLMLMK